MVDARARPLRFAVVSNKADDLVAGVPADETDVPAIDVRGERSGVSRNIICLSGFVRPSKADCGLLRLSAPPVDPTSEEATEGGRMLPLAVQSLPGRMVPNSSISLLVCLRRVWLRARDVLFENTVFIRSMMTELPEFDLPGILGRLPRIGPAWSEVDRGASVARRFVSEPWTWREDDEP